MAIPREGAMRKQKKSPRKTPKTDQKPQKSVKEIADAMLDSVMGGVGVRMVCGGRCDSSE
jgi:hypothetical protein